MKRKDLMIWLRAAGVRVAYDTILKAFTDGRLPRAEMVDGQYAYTSEDARRIAEYFSTRNKPGPKCAVNPGDGLKSPQTKTALSELPAGPELNGWLHQCWVGHVDWSDFKAWACPGYSENWESFGGLLEKVKRKGVVFSVSTTEELVDVCRRLVALRYAKRR